MLQWIDYKILHHTWGEIIQLEVLGLPIFCTSSFSSVSFSTCDLCFSSVAFEIVSAADGVCFGVWDISFSSPVTSF